MVDLSMQDIEYSFIKESGEEVYVGRCAADDQKTKKEMLERARDLGFVSGTDTLKYKLIEKIQ